MTDVSLWLYVSNYDFMFLINWFILAADSNESTVMQLKDRELCLIWFNKSTYAHDYLVKKQMEYVYLTFPRIKYVGTATAHGKYELNCQL